MSTQSYCDLCQKIKPNTPTGWLTLDIKATYERMYDTTINTCYTIDICENCRQSTHLHSDPENIIHAFRTLKEKDIE